MIERARPALADTSEPGSGNKTQDIASPGEKFARRNCLTFSEFRGLVLADLRVWYELREGGELEPSAKSIALKREHLPTVIAALSQAQREIGGEHA